MVVIEKLGISALLMPSQLFSVLINRSRSADIPGPGSGAEHHGLTDLLLFGTYGHCHRLQVHANQGSANVNTSLCPDSLDGYGVVERIPGRYRKAAACVGLGHHIDDLIAPLLGCFPLYDQSPVQMLTALDCQMDPVFPENRGYTGKYRLRRFQGRALADLLSNDLTGGAPDHKQGARPHICLFQQLCYHISSLLHNLFKHKHHPFLAEFFGIRP